MGVVLAYLVCDLRTDERSVENILEMNTIIGELSSD